MRHRELAMLIKPAGYFNIKAKRLKEFLNFLACKYKGSMEAMKGIDTASLRKELLGVHGIGPETADSILLYALQRPVFVIDAYTRRVLLRHGLVSESITYQELQEIFHANLPADTGLFNEYHALLVRLGKDYCRTRPRCEICPLHPLLKRS
jgi:endonuclease-3 related protein